MKKIQKIQKIQKGKRACVCVCIYFKDKLTKFTGTKRIIWGSHIETICIRDFPREEDIWGSLVIFLPY